MELLVLINQDKASFVNKSKPQIPKNEPYLQKCEKDLQIRFRYFLEKIQFNFKRKIRKDLNISIDLAIFYAFGFEV